MNEYLREFRELQELNSYRQEMWFGKRGDLVEKYAWAIPTDEAIERLASFDGVLEFGAGNGYWAHLIREAGGYVSAYDVDPPENTWTEVEQNDESQTATITSVSTEECLLLCWPPYDEPMATTVTRAFDGPRLAYVGEGWGGCTGDDEFHELLEENWRLEERIELPSYEGIHDDCYIYERLK